MLACDAGDGRRQWRTNARKPLPKSRYARCCHGLCGILSKTQRARARDRLPPAKSSNQLWLLKQFAVFPHLLEGGVQGLPDQASQSCSFRQARQPRVVISGASDRT